MAVRLRKSRDCEKKVDFISLILKLLLTIPRWRCNEKLYFLEIYEKFPSRLSFLLQYLVIYLMNTLIKINLA